MPVVVRSCSTPRTSVLGPVKDSHWLTLEVCRELARNKCPRPDDVCRFAHPSKDIEIQNGRVTCCYDYIKGRCQRIDPPCKYFHPPHHLKDQLLQNGRNNLIWRNIQLQGLSSTIPQFFPSMFPVSESSVNGTQPQNTYWMNSSPVDSSLSSMAYYSPVFYQGLNTLSGVVPVVKPQLIPDMRNGGVPVYQCSAPTYPQVALPPVPASQQQTCYRLAVSPVNRF